MNKKIMALVLAALLALVSLAGCGSQGNEEKETGAAPTQLQNIKFLSGPTGTTWYSQASAFSGIAAKEGITVDVLSGSAVSNVIQIENGSADMGLTFSSYMPAMVEGKVVAKVGDKEYFKEPVKNVRTLCNTTTAGYALLVSAESPYKTIADLKDKPIKYVTYPVGFTARYVPEKMLEAAGITYDSIQKAGGKVDFVGKYQEACDILAKGQADVIAYTMAVNAQSAALAELESQREFRILAIGDDVINKVTSELPLVVATIPKGMHKSVTEDTKVLADITTWVVKADMPDETVAKILDSMLKNMDSMAQVGNSEFNGFTAKELIRLYGSGSQLPLHPAAEKYFKEKGAI
ncbi:TRAP transporter solute receptor [Desulfocucumis palustris]|uniref:TRAP transporter solute receptor n=1 Tax=Desulfocucumis palustris TaxID=1898651 RepID=A0A2L2XM55_9FIRM|nr:TAXI family TRAP transporter solute-binding subunit [Desulfocucumis palustris]GBF35031.1 TRAP transporter solute receptor [Desulfocucumis palustris]